MPKRISGKFQKLENRVYTRQEMEAITGIPLTNKNFKRGVEIWLETYGYEYEITSQRGGNFIITGRADDASTRLQTMMIDELGLDRQTQPAEFAYYIYFLMTYPQAEIMPLVEQRRLINELYDRTYGANTFQTWANRLDKAGVITIDRNTRNYWKTVAIVEKIGGEMIRTDKKKRIYIEDKETDPDYRRYWDRLNEILDENQKRTGFRSWDKAFGQIWDEMGLFIYRCPDKLINIIGDHAKEMCDLARQVVEADMARLGKMMPSKVSDSIENNIFTPIIL